MTLRRERQQELIRLQVEKEHQDQMRMLKDGRRKDRPDAVQEPPTPPKTITVMAGNAKAGISEEFACSRSYMY